MKKIVICQDTRENTPWLFNDESDTKKTIKVVGQEIVTLSEGDYTIRSEDSKIPYQDLVRIERKSGLSELAGNMSPVANRDRFLNEMERLKKYPHRYIIIDSVPNMDALSLGVPQQKYPFPMKRVTEWLFQISIEYGVHIVFGGDCSAKFARQIFENIVKKYGQ